MKFTNRKIKFRVWTGATMEYRVLPGALGHFYVEGMSDKDSACLSEANTIYNESAPLMQWTGLVDKNGKEIYEGDLFVINYRSDYEILDDNGEFIEWSSKKGSFRKVLEVFWYCGDYEINCSEYTIGLNGWCVRTVKDTLKSTCNSIGDIRPIGIEIQSPNYGAYGINSSELSVSGNIFQNPELLNT